MFLNPGMQSFFWRLLFVYLGFVIFATLLALARRWIKPQHSPSDVWKKYPIYLLLNFTFLVAIMLPSRWHAVGLLAGVIGGCASWELCRALRLSRIECIVLPAAAAGLILSAEWLQPPSFVKTWAIILLASIATSGLNNHHESLGCRILGIVACLGYLPVCLAAFVWVSQTDTGYFGAIFVYGAIAVNDAFAQVVGQLVGRHKLAPRISPGKTVEGAASGIFFAALFGAILGSTAGWSYLYGALMGMVLALAGLTGDLSASSWKRALGLKDFSRLMGANGGVLDRFDAFIFAAPVFFLLSGG